MARKRPKQRVETAVAQAPLTDSPFAALGGLRHTLPQGEPQPQAMADESPAPPAPTPGRAVVRFQRKGHGGKEVTLVQQLDLDQQQLQQWLTELKRALGCGGALQQGALVLQGDQRERLLELLEQRGVKKVSIS